MAIIRKQAEIRLCEDCYTVVDIEDLPRLMDKNIKKYEYNGMTYACIRLPRSEGSKRIRLHRFLMNAPEGVMVDHINGNPLDNRKKNLRFCTHAENMRNSKKRKDGNQSRYKGVCRSGNRWRAYIQGDHLGSFRTEEEAAIAYNIEAMERYGEFARQNSLMQQPPLRNNKSFMMPKDES